MLRRIGLALVLFVGACAPRGVATPSFSTGGQAPAPAPGRAGAWEPQRLDGERRTLFAKLEPELDKLLEDDLRASRVPGMAFAIVLGGETVYAKGFGVRDVETKTPFTPDTPFAIASVSKGFTAMAILKLRDEGRLDLDAPAARYYPPLAKLAYATRDAPLVTLRHLLSHSSGLPEDNPWADVTENLTDQGLANLLDGGVMSRAAGVQFEYSNVGYTVLGRVIERVSGVPVRRYIRDEIFTPLGMMHTGWQPEDFPTGTVAVGYRGREGSRDLDAPSVVAPAEHLGVMETSGGIYTSARDLARYVSFQLGAWPARDDSESGPLKRSSVREMQQGKVTASISEFTPRLVRRFPVPIARVTPDGLAVDAVAYGFGLMSRRTCETDLQVEHSGGLPGYKTFLLMLPEWGVGAVLFLNDERASFKAMSGVMKLLRNAGLLVPRRVQPLPALVSARAAIDGLLARWDDDEARSIFEPSFFRYQTIGALKERFAALGRDHGACRLEGEPMFVNRLRGRWRETCERGAITFAAGLAPGPKPRIQSLELREDVPPGPALERAAAALIDLFARWDARAASALLAKTVEGAKLERTFGALAILHGTCKLGVPVESDGKTRAIFALACRERPLELSVTLDGNGRVASVSAEAPRAEATPNCAE
jgi:CubicO group peptidase (beta-lactamase class C family)